MGKKYIIEIEDGKEGIILCQKGIVTVGLHLENESELKPLGIQSAIPYTEPDLEQVRKEAYADGYKTAKVQCNIQAEKDLREVGERHYQKGLSDAWDAARKIWEYDTTTLRAIFGEGIMRMDWFMNITASEAIEKLKAYEQEQEEIKVGDEVLAPFGTAVVTNIVDDKIWFCYADGHCGFDYKKDKPRKTGRHFPEIATILENMRGEQDG